MKNVAEVVDLPLTASKGALLRALGYPRSHRPAISVARVIEKTLRVAPSLIQARGACRVVDRTEIAAAAMPRATALVGIGLCTIGPALEEQSRRLSLSGRMLEALVLDAYGSAAAEAAADALEHLLQTKAGALGYQLQVRISPGYGRWDVQNQAALLSLLPAAVLGVRLTDGMMMVPRKSVSFAVRFCPARVRGPRSRAGCSRCDRKRCDYRRTQ